MKVVPSIIYQRSNHRETDIYLISRKKSVHAGKPTTGSHYLAQEGKKC